MNAPQTQSTTDLTALFDLSFTKFLTIGVVKIIYLLGMVGLALVWFGIVVSGFSQSLVAGLFAIVIATLVALIYLLILRVWLELVVVLFRIGDNTSAIAAAIGGSVPPTGGFPVQTISQQ
jgi:hypothetical protein